MTMKELTSKDIVDFFLKRTVMTPILSWWDLCI